MSICVSEALLSRSLGEALVSLSVSETFVSTSVSEIVHSKRQHVKIVGEMHVFERRAIAHDV